MDADAKGEKADVSQGLKTWIQDLRETAYSIEDVIDEYLLHLGNSTSKISDIQKKVVKLKETSSTYGFISSVQPGSGGRSTSAPWHDPRVTSLFIDDAEIVGIGISKRKLTSRLVEGTSKRTVISVVGMGGLGKTLLQEVIQMEELLRNMSKKFYQSRKEAVPEGINTMDQSSLMTLTRQYLQDKKLEELSLDIVKRCGGLPLAIVAVGGLLSRKEKLIPEWKKFNDTIGFLFLYLAIFPEDYTIRCRPLTRLWIAEGFVKAKRGVTLEEVAEEFLTELIHRSLVQVSNVSADGRIKYCHVHDLMREIILTKAEELSFCCVMGEETSSLMEDLGAYQFIIAQIIFNLLKVLDIDDSGLDSVTENLGNLLHLRYLSLRNTKVRMLPRSIGKLQNLQTLDLRFTLVEDLPVEINRLKKLRNILVHNYDLDRDLGWLSVKGVQVKEGIGCLEELQKLSCVEANHGVGVIKELGKLRQLRKLGITKLTRENGEHLCASITNMNRLESLLISSLSENEVLDLQYISHPPSCLSCLQLVGPLEKLPDWVSELQNLSRVSLCGSNLMNDPVQVLQALPSLQILQLMRASAVEELCFDATGFQKLKRLDLLDLMGVKRAKIENGALPLLEELSVGTCPQLEELPPGIRHLTRLTTLEFLNLQEELKLSMGIGVSSSPQWQ
ncbi:Disease resistance protein RPM1 [Vitis vinifera]|uniref:Disease resistance protein RPM1 n=1 Tax=Vitis vinifera TaxID=29760 RepID=A0A438C7I4_VITVI|nr:Disease resistance protein RPM1 [Vitis vinifera]